MSRTSLFEGFDAVALAASRRSVGFLPAVERVEEKQNTGDVLFSGFEEDCRPLTRGKKIAPEPNWRRMACAPSSKLGRRARRHPYADAVLRYR